MSKALSSLYSGLLESSPLRRRVFRLFYFGSIGAALGYTIQATIAAWLMATLTPSTLMVAMVQTASTLPSLLFGLVAGALADIVERRRIILITQIVLVIATAVLGITALAGLIGPASLLALTFVVGTGFTFYLPAQQANINELVPPEELHRAVALGAVAFNAARALGPALAGAIVAWVNSGSAFLVSAACFTTMILAVRQLRAQKPALPGVPERLLAGVLSGLRFVRHSPGMRSLVLRNFSFGVCASAFWALLPVIARDQLGLGAGGFGLLSAAFGLGAIVGALSIPAQLLRRSLNSVVISGTLLWTLAILLIAATDQTAVAVGGTFGAGMAWVCVFASLTAGTQSTAPAWVRARAVGTSLVAVQASLAIGSVFWGALASATGIRMALASSAAMMLVLYGLSYRVRVALGSEAEVTPGFQLPELAMAIEPMPEDGPVLIQVEYRIDHDQRDAFLQAIQAVEPTRRRNGAMSWRVFRDLGEEGSFIERFIIASWAEYVRLRNRATVADRKAHAALEQFQRPGVPIRVSRLIGVDLRNASFAPDAISGAGADAGRG
jgi:MFS family permease